MGRAAKAGCLRHFVAILDERDQQIVLLVDSGRRMRAKDDELSHFDHSLNAMLLVLSPCLYCDVTDSWRVDSRRRRHERGQPRAGRGVPRAAAWAAGWR